MLVGHSRGWYVTVFPTAGEAGGSFSAGVDSVRGSHAVPVPDPVRSAAEAARRARTKTRRYCAANGLNRLGTLTYRGEGCHDPLVLRRDVGGYNMPPTNTLFKGDYSEMLPVSERPPVEEWWNRSAERQD